MKSISVVLPYYENFGMLQRQLETFAHYPAEYRKWFELIVVDDGSPRNPAAFMIDPGAHARLYRCEVDVRWNWLFCRNLGASRALHDWLLLTDIDHLIPWETMRAAIEDSHDPARVYRFSRVSEPELLPYKPHPNSWFLTREKFDEIGGYDERFSGYYGSDGDFRDRVVATAGPPVMLPEVLIRVPREVTPDASTVDYLRKQPEDHAGITRIRAERELDADQRPRRLSFPWHRVL